MRFARGLAHEAAIYEDQAEQLWEILDTASRDAPGYDQGDNRKRWLRHIHEAFSRDKPITIATVFDLAKKHGWQGWSPPVMTTTSAPVIWSAAELNVSFSRVPHRRWLYGTYLIRGEITVVAAPGGAREDSARYGNGRRDCDRDRAAWGEDLWRPDLKVLFINAEDGGAEIARRIWRFAWHMQTKSRCRALTVFM